jgi:hypothetical protein
MWITKNTKPTKRSLVLLCFFVGVVAVFVAARGISRDLSNRRLVHAQNMTKAERFKHEFDAAVPKGTALAAVEGYLRTKDVNVRQQLRLVMEFRLPLNSVVSCFSCFS